MLVKNATSAWGQSATIEDLCKRFPHLGALIFANLDDQTFTKCKEANKEIPQFFNRERFYWIRIIRHYHDNPGFLKCFKILLWGKGPHQDNSTPHCNFEKQFGTFQTHSK